MKVIKPVTITDAMLISSTAPETDHPAWSAATTYALAARVILTSTHRIYESLQAANLNKPPASNPTWWLDVAPTNRWACFDQRVNTATGLASPLTITLAAGYANALALLGLVGDQALVTVTDGPGGALVYSRTVQLDGTLLVDWYQYFFEPRLQLAELALVDLPPYVDARITASITGVAAVACSTLVVGAAYTLGDTRYGAKLNIIDYSRKDTDAFGVTTFVRRAFSKRMAATLLLPTGQINKIQQVLADLRATPCVWVGMDAEPTGAYSALIVFGFYRDFSISVDYPSYSACSLDIEGLT